MSCIHCNIAHNFQVFQFWKKLFFFWHLSQKKRNFGLGNFFLKFCEGETSCLLSKKEGMDHKKRTRIALKMVIRLGKPQNDGN